MRVWIVSLLLLSCMGCGDDGRNWKETIPVNGEIYVDGQPADGVLLKFHPVGGMDTAQPTETTGMTNAEGKFSASTYEPGDGAPEGKYQVTFTWPKLNTMSMAFEGDKLKGKYNSPEKSGQVVEVVAGTPVDMGRIELKTQ